MELVVVKGLVKFVNELFVYRFQYFICFDASKVLDIDIPVAKREDCAGLLGKPVVTDSRVCNQVAKVCLVDFDCVD